MDGLPPDLGKFASPGYLNANPPDQPVFALSASGTGIATSIGQAGGLVAVNGSGGIGLTVPGLATIQIDVSNNITLAAGTGVINILTQGNGNDVNILEAGTIAFDILGAGAIQNVQTINGIAYPPPGGGGGTSITQAGALVACLGNGAINISSIGAGASVDIFNAGRITFDTAGVKDISGVSTINGARYIPAGSISSIAGAGANVTCLSGGTISCQASGGPFLTLNGAGGVVPNKIALTCGANRPEIVLGASGSNDIAISNLYSTTPSFMTMDVSGEIVISGSAVNITNLSTVNGVQFINGSSPYVLPSDITVSTLTAASYVSTLALEGISSINAVAWPLTSIGDIANTYVVTDGFSVTLGGNGSAPAIEVTTNNTVYLGDGVATVNISNLSTINGSAYPVFMSTIGDIATGGFVYTTTSNVLMGVGATAFSIDSSNNLTVGSATADTSIVYASTIQTSSSGLNIYELSAGANVKLDTGGRVKFNEGLSTITDGTGLIVGIEGSTLTFPLDPTAVINVGAIANLSTINGVAYPPIVAAKQATYYKSAGQNMTSGANDVTFDLSGAWNNPDGYITHTDGTTDFTVVQTGLYQLEFNATIVANGATWGTGSNKTINIDITRSPNGEHAIIANAALTSSASNYAQCVSGTYYLEAGDIINLRVFNVFATAVPEIQHVTNTFDLGTFFTWRFIP